MPAAGSLVGTFEDLSHRESRPRRRSDDAWGHSRACLRLLPRPVGPDRSSDRGIWVPGYGGLDSFDGGDEVVEV